MDSSKHSIDTLLQCGLPRRLLNHLCRAGYRHAEEVVDLADAPLLSVKGVGRDSIPKIRLAFEIWKLHYRGTGVPERYRSREVSIREVVCSQCKEGDEGVNTIVHPGIAVKPFWRAEWEFLCGNLRMLLGWKVRLERRAVDEALVLVTGGGKGRTTYFVYFPGESVEDGMLVAFEAGYHWLQSEISAAGANLPWVQYLSHLGRNWPAASDVWKRAKKVAPRLYVSLECAHLRGDSGQHDRPMFCAKTGRPCVGVFYDFLTKTYMVEMARVGLCPAREDEEAER